MEIKIGVRVRFLDSVGGGRVTRIVKDTVYVEDEDGFEIPTPANKCVVVGEEPQTVSQPSTAKFQPKTKAEQKASTDTYDVADELEKDVAEPEPTRSPYSYLPAQGEVNVLLGYASEEISKKGDIGFRTYLINDSDYTLYYYYGIETTVGKKMRAHGMLAPHQLVLVDRFSPPEVNLRSQFHFHAIAFSENPGDHKATYSIRGAIKSTKLFEPKSFVDNSYTEESLYILPLVLAGQIKQKEIQADSVTDLGDGEGSASTISEPLSLQSPTISPTLNAPLLGKSTEPVLDLSHKHFTVGASDLGAASIFNKQLAEFDKCMVTQLRKSGQKFIVVYNAEEHKLKKKIEERLKFRYKGLVWRSLDAHSYQGEAIEINIP